MANRERGEITIDVNGTSYTLVFNTSAMLAAEELASTPQKEVTWDQILARISAGSVRMLLILLWAMLRKYHPDTTLEDVQRLIDDAGGLTPMKAIIERAHESATADPKDVQALKRPPAAQGSRERTRRTRQAGAASTSTLDASA